MVVTSVTRDDLEDGGAEHFAETITEIKQLPGGIRVEVLIPDFQGSHGALKTVLDAGPDVLNHNIETIPALYPKARPEADYQRSLDLLKKVAEITPSIPAKSGIMVGLGENFDEIKVTLNDLFDHGCTILTMGQYLQPSRNHLAVEKYYTPGEFDDLKRMAEKIGFRKVASAPFVRSSYQAGKLFRTVQLNLSYVD